MKCFKIVRSYQHFIIISIANLVNNREMMFRKEVTLIALNTITYIGSSICLPIYLKRIMNKATGPTASSKVIENTVRY
ncbi:hypothetical protein SAMN05428988_4368 [Chitinophaga sp. YR573]|uniref:hypothetical protein n=1 Tax=Chitinophaga sp. YR573 TaxID=1881040 RepID=UPI0008B85C93|nr:hypothetical protein [Chitinophaga sp. YR573]SEW35640.1 hypothetical protein SAMN05428988_4368 [Chitinophaga sp. YR573]